VTTTLFDARLAYRRKYGFGDDGGVNKAYDWFWMFGVIPMIVPNPPARKKVIDFHDVHHTLTGYSADWRGEFEESAWELGAGCTSSWIAIAINTGGLGSGLLTMPIRTAKAFYRGRRMQSLYGRDLKPWLDRPIDDVRRDLGFEAEPRPLTASDHLALLGYGGAGILAAFLHLAAAAAVVGALVAWLA
jgi:hypothetical protein